MINMCFWNNFQLLLFYFSPPFQSGIEWNSSILSFTLSILFWYYPFLLFLSWIVLLTLLVQESFSYFSGGKLAYEYAKENIFLSFISFLRTMHWWGSEILSDLRFLRSNSICSFVCLFQVEWNWFLFYWCCSSFISLLPFLWILVFWWWFLVVLQTLLPFAFDCWSRDGFYQGAIGFYLVPSSRKIGLLPVPAKIGSCLFHDFRIFCSMGRFVLYLAWD